MCKFARCLFGTSSILIIISGLAIFIATLTMYTTLNGYEKSMGDDDQSADQSDITIDFDIQEGGLYVMIGASVLALVVLLVGCLGCSAYRKTSKCKICTFGVLTCILGLILIVTGGFLSVMYGISEERIDKFCSMAVYEPTPINKKTTRGDLRRMNWKQEARNRLGKVDDMYSDKINAYMCTDYCKCVEVDQTKWESDAETSLASRNSQFDGAMSTWTQCIQELGQNPTKNQKNLMKMVGFWEQNLQCAGACNAPLFWGTKDIRTGPPTRSCIYAAKDEYDKRIGPIGLCVGISAVCMIFAYSLHWWMYCAPAPENSEEAQKQVQMGEKQKKRKQQYSRD